MKKIYRNKNNIEYWEERWAHNGVDREEFANRNIYPIKYADLALDLAKYGGGGGDLHLLEAGCGSGRLYFDYFLKGYNIVGIERSSEAVKAILAYDKNAKVLECDINELPFSDNEFDLIYAFGLYHNLESEDMIKKALNETHRVIKKPNQQQKGGLLCFSVRGDSLENRTIEYIMRLRSKEKFDQFHRMHFDLEDIHRLLAGHFEIIRIEYVRNVSFLFKFNFLRAKNMKKGNFKESEARSEGFQLNYLGKALDWSMRTLFPKAFSNLMVIFARAT